MEGLSLVSPEWELIDPNPDIYALFSQFNIQFFWGTLCSVEVKWSPRMTLCAGICRYEKRAGYCSIGLSVPLLKLRPRKDLVETLLHEMIHAYLFVTANNRDREGHGPEFQKHMMRINKTAGTNITIYHSFHAEVRLYKQHWWRCTGTCTTRPPFYGFVKRSMNRAPGPNDIWWEQHKATCSGVFIKVKEPEGYGKKGSKGKDTSGSSSQTTPKAPDIRKFFSPTKAIRSKSPDQPKVPRKTVGPSVTPMVGPTGVSKPTVPRTTSQKGLSDKPSINGPSLDVKPSTSGANRVPGRPNLNGPSFKNPAPRSATGGGRLKSNGTTITVQGKTSKADKGRDAGCSDTTVPVFKGEGHTLGGASSGVSRLLSQFDSGKTISKGGNSSGGEKSKPATSALISGKACEKGGKVKDAAYEEESKESKSNVGKMKKERKRVYVIDSESDGESPGKASKRREKSPDLIELDKEPSSGRIAESAESNNGKIAHVPCPVCCKSVPENSINEHLDSCIESDSGKVDTEIVGDFIDDSDGVWEVSQVADENATFYPCPVCAEQVLACDMNAHLDRCAL